jgi:hypothetical protein
MPNYKGHAICVSAGEAAMTFEEIAELLHSTPKAVYMVYATGNNQAVTTEGGR